MKITKRNRDKLDRKLLWTFILVLETRLEADLRCLPSEYHRHEEPSTSDLILLKNKLQTDNLDEFEIKLTVR